MSVSEEFPQLWKVATSQQSEKHIVLTFFWLGNGGSYMMLNDDFDINFYRANGG